LATGVAGNQMTDNTLGFGEKRFWVRDMGHGV
jgi:uncharacterized protein YhbP (UPF0306 family)